MRTQPHLQGEADKLTSAFHVTYNMILNLLRVEELNPEYMLERSFFQFQHRAALPELETSMSLSLLLAFVQKPAPRVQTNRFARLESMEMISKTY